MELNRTKQGVLLDWLRSPRRKPLLLRGARQVGKSTLVRQFAKAAGKECFEINLEVHAEFESTFKTLQPDKIMRALEVFFRKPLNPETSILFLDEIQAVPSAIVALRYFYEKMPELPVIGAGSLLEFALISEPISMPVGRIEFAHLMPMSFVEFLEALEETQLIEALHTFSIGEDLDIAHQRLSERYREYTWVGGMPEAVSVYRDSNFSLEEVYKVHQAIISTYLEDFTKYIRKIDPTLMRSVFRRIPTQIGQKLKYSKLYPDESHKKIKPIVDALILAKIVHPVHHSDGNGVPLFAQSDERTFKPLFLDVALVNHLCGLEPKQWLDAAAAVNQGALAEQFVGQELLAIDSERKSPELFYWVREGKQGNAELDYLWAWEGKVFPIEVKSGTEGSLKSLHQFQALKNGQVGVRFDLNPSSMQRVKHNVQIHGTSVEHSYTLISLPIYAVCELPRILGNL